MISPYKPASLLLLLILTGCATRTIDTQHFHSLTQRRGLGHFYYTGTKGEFHHFAESYFLKPTYHYRLPVSAYPVTNTLPRTSDRSLWIPWEVNLASGTEGFNPNPANPVNPVKKPK